MFKRLIAIYLCSFGIIGCDSKANPERVQGEPELAAAATPVLHGIDLERCVVQSGEVKAKTRRITPAGSEPGPVQRISTCAYSAECVRARGSASLGDGSVTLSCEDLRCSCRYLADDGDAKEHFVDFEVSRPCDSAERATEMLEARCLQRAK